ncbi:MAG: hypothetical protein HN578_15090 [Rhodospirillales bacterium]|jgi:hypothetical protein|nr:hypothetical protein [Rhodospirillales bacterium]MBT3905382.1 hypothetical protein [Rhodospirillaceae bacterium]MBT5033816.1 hypothetical protein [Rhodospirillaceae bacterium]MBT6222124.1 hypothetical protein [Rhodospirillaceae bacterium]MBT6363664.1 hypothetical protein [Rhodospirillaceae bacterium]
MNKPIMDEPSNENQEGLIFSKIIRHITEQLSDLNEDQPPEEVEQIKSLFIELADSFEHSSGFEYVAEQALPLSQAFAMLAAAMQALSNQASTLGHSDAAAKMQWAAATSKNITARLEENHLSGAGGIIALDDREADLEIVPTNETIQ